MKTKTNKIPDNFENKNIKTQNDNFYFNNSIADSFVHKNNKTSFNNVNNKI